MTRKVWFQLMDAATCGVYADTTAAAVSSDGVSDIDDLRVAIREKYCHESPDILEGIIADQLRIYADEAAYKEKKQYSPRSPLNKLDAQSTLIVVVPPQQRSDVSVESTEAQWEKLLNTLEWKEPKRLCESSGQDWPYQVAPEVVDRLVDPLIEHYNAWQCRKEDKQSHAINLVLSGPGTGKSRMLDEMKGLLCTAAARSKNQALMDRMKNAYVFRVTFENGTSATGSLLNRDFPEFDVSYRMIYQLVKDRKPWSLFVDKLSEMCSSLRLRIHIVIDILAELEKIDNVRDMTVVLCVDGLQKLVNNGIKSCDLYRVLASICSFLNSSTAFAVCVCSATVQQPISKALADSPQQRVFLVPPPLRGHEVLATRTRIEKQLVDDLGGHGRALEALQKALSHYTKEQLEETDPTHIVDRVYEVLQRKYGDVFNSPLFDDETNCKEVLVAILLRRRYGVFDRIGRTTLTVDNIRSFGLFRLSEEGHLECAFILLVALMRKLSKKLGEVDNFNHHLMRSVLVWQRFEQFVAFYRSVKSIVFRQTPIALSTFHIGARFGSIRDIMIEEPHSRTVEEAIEEVGEQVGEEAVEEAVHQHGAKSGATDHFHTNCNGLIEISKMKSIIINGPNASAGDIFMRIQLEIDQKKAQCNEVIQCKLLNSEQTINQKMYDEEREKAVNEDSDVFLLITAAEEDNVALPPRCGIVSKNEFEQYFGPFASHAYRSLLEPPDINTASYHELRRVEGVGDANAKKIINERKKRLYSSLEDAMSRLFKNKRCKTAEILRAMHCAGKGAVS